MTTQPPIDLPFVEAAEEAYHAPIDYLQASNRRKNAAILGLGILVAVLTFGLVSVATKARPSWVLAVAPNGEEYVLSEPKKALDMRDMVIYNSVRQDLMSWAKAYFDRNKILAQKDYEDARWFFPDNVRNVYDAAALGPHGWIAGLETGQIPQSTIKITSVELRPVDLDKEPYLCRIYYTRFSENGQASSWIAKVAFVVRPQEAMKASRMPLFNALGVLVLQEPSEIPDFRQ